MELTFQAVKLFFSRHDKPLLKNISFNLNSGEMLWITGQNGVGKTTLLKILSGLIIPNKGKILFCNFSIKHNSNYLSNLCYLGHKLGLKLGLTVLENINFPNYFEMLQYLNLADYQNHLVGQLSAGQKQRVALINLFLSPAKIWILDEPLSNLDNNVKEIFREKSKMHLIKGGIIIMASHEELGITCHKTMLHECKLTTNTSNVF